MSWIEKIENRLTITTGDGKKYTPNWVNAVKTVGYNIASFEFPNVPGTLVNRGQVQGAKYNLEFYFQGEDHLDEAAAFELSARDPRYWTLVHPFYGELKVHPVELTFDNSTLNISKVSGQVLETIDDVYPKGTTDPGDKIADDKTDLDESGSQNYADSTTPGNADKKVMSTTIDDADQRSSISDNLQAADFRNKVNDANRKINNATGKPLAAIRAIDAVLNYPAQIQNNTLNRFNQLTTALGDLIGKIGNSPQTVPNNQKRYHEKVLTSTVSAYAAATGGGGGGGSNGIQSRGQALQAAEIMQGAYDQAIEAIDSMQTTSGGTLTSYTPNQNTLIALQDIITFTISNLLAIAVTVNQEHAIITDRETNLILLAHRLYGLDSVDENIQTLIDTNEIGLNEMLNIRKGRRILYYV